MIDKDLKEKIFEKKYYVYELIDPENNEVFYVGKGNKYRCFTHEYKSKNGKIPHRNKHLYNKINKILNNGNNIIYNIIYTSNDEKLCYSVEEDKIKEIGIENLCNIEISNKGVKHTEETIDKIRIANTGKKHTDETKEKLRIINTGKKHTDESKKLMSIANSGRKSRLGKKLTEEHKKCISVANKGKKHTDESIQKMKEKHKGKIISEEQREKIRKKLSLERIEKIMICENCGNEYVVTIKKDGVNKIRRGCNRNCSAQIANKTKN